MSGSTSTKPASDPTALSGSTASVCCPSFTSAITRCPTRRRATWKWSLQSGCGRKATACGRHDEGPHDRSRDVRYETHGLDVVSRERFLYDCRPNREELWSSSSFTI